MVPTATAAPLETAGVRTGMPTAITTITTTTTTTIAPIGIITPAPAAAVIARRSPATDRAPGDHRHPHRHHHWRHREHDHHDDRGHVHDHHHAPPHSWLGPCLGTRRCGAARANSPPFARKVASRGRANALPPEDCLRPVAMPFVGTKRTTSEELATTSVPGDGLGKARIESGERQSPGQRGPALRRLEIHVVHGVDVPAVQVAQQLCQT